MKFPQESGRKGLFLKIGKTKYLSLLDLSSSFDEERTLIIQPLTKVYEEIRKNAEDRILEYQDEINKSQDEVIDDETGMTSHDLLGGQIEDISFEYHLQTAAVATSLIIVAQSYLHSKFQNIISAYDYFKETYKTESLRNYYFSMGEKVNGTAWADGVKAASNYVRHYEEWKVKSSKYEKIDGQMIISKLSNLISQVDARFRGTPNTLLALGFSEDEVFDKRNNLTPKIVEKLKLNDANEFSRLATVWIEAVMTDLHQKFDSRD